MSDELQGKLITREDGESTEGCDGLSHRAEGGLASLVDRQSIVDGGSEADRRVVELLGG